MAEGYRPGPGCQVIRPDPGGLHVVRRLGFRVAQSFGFRVNSDDDRDGELSNSLALPCEQPNWATARQLPRCRQSADRACPSNPSNRAKATASRTKDCASPSLSTRIHVLTRKKSNTDKPPEKRADDPVGNT